MSYKQEKHGKKGEARTRDILLDHFILHEIVPDIEGRDFMAELHNNISPVNAIIQSKYFQDTNEVLIRREYIFNEEGIKTEFFAILHSDDSNSNPIRYFFSAQDINDTWRISTRKVGNKKIAYHVFKLNKKNFEKFEPYKGISKPEINRKIEEGILKTDEYQNQKNILKIKEGFKNPTQQVFETHNKELFNRIQKKPIVEKLFEALSDFKDFRRIVSWRLINKIAFLENPRTNTYYHNFTLNTNHTEIINFFKNIEIGKQVKVKKNIPFKKSSILESKASQIVEILNDNLIFKLCNTEERSYLNIALEKNDNCTCPACTFDSLNFVQASSMLQKKNQIGDLWKKMLYANVWFRMGNYEKAKISFEDVAKKANQNREFIVFFFAKYNERLAAIRNFDSSHPDLNVELEKLPISNEKREILRSLADYSLVNSYAKSIDDSYLQIKEYKQRKVVNDTANIAHDLYSKIIEYINFFEGNWLIINEFEEFKVLFEKVVEACIVSYSMNTEYTSHVDSFNDPLVQMALNRCDPNKLLSYFQRNNVRNIPYKSKSRSLQTAIENLFSTENLDFLKEEVCYVERRSKNPHLRRRVTELFYNVCILLTYLDHDINLNDFLKKVIAFIQKLDFHILDLSPLAHPLLAKSELFSTSEVLRLTNLLLSRDDKLNGYLLTNCINTLISKGYKIPKTNQNLANELIDCSIKASHCNLLKPISKILNEGHEMTLMNKIDSELTKRFNYELFTNSVISETIQDPHKYIDKYLESISKFLEKQKDVKYFAFRSPYTGLSDRKRNEMNRLTDVLLTINDHSIMQHPLVQNIAKIHPYYNFIINIDNFTNKENFKICWILENQSEIVLDKLSQNAFIKAELKKHLLKHCDKKLSKIYVKYFT